MVAAQGQRDMQFGCSATESWYEPVLKGHHIMQMPLRDSQMTLQSKCTKALAHGWG